MQRKLAILVAILKYFSSSDFRESYRTMTCTAEKSIICNKMCLTAMHAGIVTQPPLYTTYRVHSLEKYSIFSTSTVIDQKTRSVHIYGHLNTYILLFDYRTLLVYTLQLTFKVGVSSVFECYWLMAYNGKANC